MLAELKPDDNMSPTPTPLILEMPPYFVSFAYSQLISIYKCRPVFARVFRNLRTPP